MALVLKNLSANAGDIRDTGLIPESGRSPGGGHKNPLQYSYLENPMDRGAWRATVHRVAKSWTRLSNWACTHNFSLDPFLEGLKLQRKSGKSELTVARPADKIGIWAEDWIKVSVTLLWYLREYSYSQEIHTEVFRVNCHKVYITYSQVGTCICMHISIDTRMHMYIYMQR